MNENCRVTKVGTWRSIEDRPNDGQYCRVIAADLSEYRTYYHAINHIFNGIYGVILWRPDENPPTD